MHTFRKVKFILKYFVDDVRLLKFLIFGEFMQKYLFDK